ncbi:AAA-like domain-containing protein [Microcoleus sp. CAWBG58]|uniref:AAA-like domain-containing protein n=1 Tax=Microcoleus sp. CAWBG58 TaxID=2841651 RepID=UPI0025D6D4B4|nr:AAA-like domain-containing protein [Microcoleus sp. CAWBG58]
MANPKSSLGKLNDEKIKILKIIKAELGTGGEKKLSYRNWAKILHKTQNPTRRLLLQFQELGAINITTPPKKGPVPCTFTWLAKGDEILRQASESQAIKKSKGTNKVSKIDLLTGVVPLDSNLYVEREADKKSREPVQTVKSMPFIRVKGAKGMGKSSLLVRLRHFLKTEQDQIVGFVDLAGDSFEPEAFTNLNQLLEQFTYAIAQTFSKSVSSLNPPPLKEYWHSSDLTSGLKCADYLHQHIFSKIKQPKTLLIDGIDKVLGQKNTQDYFCGMLRTWNETRMKNPIEAPIIWPSIVIAYSTEPYSEDDVKGSPLNIGIEVILQEFSPEQLENLSERYQLELNPNEINKLYNLIDGHPALTNSALYFLAQDGKKLSDLDNEATELNGPFGNHLLHIWEILQDHPSLRQCLIKIMKGEKYDNFLKFQLEKAWLVKNDARGARVRCELYQRFFDVNNLEGIHG